MGDNTIHYEGHVRMMGAVQPFISGAISKTINMASEATVEQIGDAYRMSWELGLKANALYRDGSKRTQPLNTAKEEERKAEVIDLRQRRAIRVKLSDERSSVTHKFSIAGHEGYITVGLFDDGTPGEIFLTMAKEGSTISGFADAFAAACASALAAADAYPSALA